MRFKGFELDPFQERAINSLKDGHSVIVAAPTGAGKTVIAEYAIEQAIANDERIIYTAPIKALSNQKFRDFSSDYPDKIGIMTGDVIINPEAQVQIMTTEIYRNIIFEGEEGRLDQIHTVIFDEIHYINDIQRGTVWEESIIFAPQHIRFICLSATIPNFAEFGDWMRRVRTIPIETISEHHRPVPLKTALYVQGMGFRNLEFIRSLEKQKIDRKKKRTIGNVELIERLKAEDKLPCLYFHFSRAGCEDYAQFFKGINFLTNLERKSVLRAFDALAEQFGVSKRSQVMMMRNLLKVGIAYHHAGVLPALKEIIERLYTMGLIKLLFTTETFAVGINMPARSVIFDNLMKHDGITFRYLTAREFQQMAGRAGRRGIDREGYVYACVNPADASYEGVKQAMSHDAEDIESQFSLSYSSILNLYQSYGDGIYEACEKSFNTFKTIGQLKELKEKLAKAEDEVRKLRNEECEHGGDVVARMLGYIKTRDEFFRLKGLLRKRRRQGKDSRFKTVEQLVQIKQDLAASPCDGCRRHKHCANIAKKVRRHEKEARDITSESFDMENSQRELLSRRLKFLEHLGYIGPEGLLPRGVIASQIFGYEIQFTELYFEGFFEMLKEEEINVLVSAIVFESRRGASYRKQTDSGTARMLRDADELIEKLRNMEKEAGLSSIIKTLDPKLSRAVFEWSRGCRFEDLKTFASDDDGDLVRSFRLIVDFLKQMKRAIRAPGFRDKIDRCVKLIYRDVVDAESQLKSEIAAYQEELKKKEIDRGEEVVVKPEEGIEAEGDGNTPDSPDDSTAQFSSESATEPDISGAKEAENGVKKA